MTKRIKKNINWLKALTALDDTEQNQVLIKAKPENVNALCDCIKNVLVGTIPLKSSIKTKIKTKKNILRRTTDKKVKVPERRRLLVQHGGGLISAILIPALAALSENLLK